MINLRFNISNPWSRRWGIVKVWHGKLPWANKFWELQIDKTDDIIGLEFKVTVRTSHAGIWFSLALAGFEIVFNAYDNRHWDDVEQQWETSK